MKREREREREREIEGSRAREIRIYKENDGAREGSIGRERPREIYIDIERYIEWERGIHMDI